MYLLQGLPTGGEKAVVLFERTCLNRRSEMHSMAQMFTGLDGRCRVRSCESFRADGNESAYTLDRFLRVVHVQVTESFRLAHSQPEMSDRWTIDRSPLSGFAAAGDATRIAAPATFHYQACQDEECHPSVPPSWAFTVEPLAVSKSMAANVALVMHSSRSRRPKSALRTAGRYCGVDMPIGSCTLYDHIFA